MIILQLFHLNRSFYFELDASSSSSLLMPSKLQLFPKNELLFLSKKANLSKTNNNYLLNLIKLIISNEYLAFKTQDI